MKLGTKERTSGKEIEKYFYFVRSDLDVRYRCILFHVMNENLTCANITDLPIVHRLRISQENERGKITTPVL